jgi:hypothetical protein
LNHFPEGKLPLLSPPALASYGDLDVRHEAEFRLTELDVDALGSIPRIVVPPTLLMADALTVGPQVRVDLVVFAFELAPACGVDLLIYRDGLDEPPFLLFLEGRMFEAELVLEEKVPERVNRL